MIKEFKGRYAFLSNFYDVPVEYNGIRYLNSEAAFQAQKTTDEAERVKFTHLNPSEAKRKGRSIKLCDDWENIKLNIMYEICYAKFTQNPDLNRKLLQTGNQTLVEGNTWNDTFWGMCNGIGENNLGKILMKIRSELKSQDYQVKIKINGSELNAREPVYIMGGNINGKWLPVTLNDKQDLRMWSEPDISFSPQKCYISEIKFRKDKPHNNLYYFEISFNNTAFKIHADNKIFINNDAEKCKELFEKYCELINLKRKA